MPSEVQHLLISLLSISFQLEIKTDNLPWTRNGKLKVKEPPQRYHHLRYFQIWPLVSFLGRKKESILFKDSGLWSFCYESIGRCLICPPQVITSLLHSSSRTPFNSSKVLCTYHFCLFMYDSFFLAYVFFYHSPLNLKLQCIPRG